VQSFVAAEEVDHVYRARIFAVSVFKGRPELIHCQVDDDGFEFFPCG
jgi:hypothetical protein